MIPTITSFRHYLGKNRKTMDSKHTLMKVEGKLFNFNNKCLKYITTQCKFKGDQLS